MGRFELQIQFDDDSKETAEVYVEGKLQGEGCRFLLDTGCARSSLNYDEFSSRFEKIATEESSGIFGRSQYDLVKVDRIEFGEIEKNNVVLSRAKKGELDRNLLGMDMLKDYRLHFVFDKSIVEINPPAPENNLSTRELILDGGSIPYIKFQIDDSDIMAVWDTGASVTLVDMGLIEKYSTMFEKIGSEVGTDSIGSKMETPTYNMKPICIGDHEFPAHKVVGVNLSHVNANTDIPMGFIFGYSTLNKANWLFDFPQKQWAILEMISAK